MPAHRALGTATRACEAAAHQNGLRGGPGWCVAPLRCGMYLYRNIKNGCSMTSCRSSPRFSTKFPRGATNFHSRNKSAITDRSQRFAGSCW